MDIRFVGQMARREDSTQNPAYLWIGSEISTKKKKREKKKRVNLHLKNCLPLHHVLSFIKFYLLMIRVPLCHITQIDNLQILVKFYNNCELGFGETSSLKGNWFRNGFNPNPRKWVFFFKKKKILMIYWGISNPTVGPAVRFLPTKNHQKWMNLIYYPQLRGTY